MAGIIGIPGRHQSESRGFCEVAQAVGWVTAGRDLIEAGLNEPAGWQSSYGDCVNGTGSETGPRGSEACEWISAGWQRSARTIARRQMRAAVTWC